MTEDEGKLLPHGQETEMEMEKGESRVKKKVCVDTFLFLRHLKLRMFRNIRRIYTENGLVPRVHGNTRRLPVNALTFSDVSHIVTFFRHCAEVHAVLLPRQIPGYKRSDLQLLPCSTTKHSI